jgi:phosphohistidine phosphatase SixA/8-oxo-dGTP pyrophosphatase MutT (NUDIX family)
VAAASKAVPGKIRAAGGAVWREDQGVLRVAVIHRDRYDDWTLPKGKLVEGERELDAAVREVREEIGATVAVTRRLIETEYLVTPRRGDVPIGVRDSSTSTGEQVPKTVQYWAMRYRSGEFTPNAEVDDLVWASLDDARSQLSHDVERAVLDSFTATPAPQAVVVLVRHAKAGKRSQWPDDDRLRPLDKAGRRQARGLTRFLSAFAPTRVVAADRVRCVQTVEPFANSAGLEVEIDPALADEVYLNDPDTARVQLLEIAKSAPAAVVCSQGAAVPGLVADLAGVENVVARKGSAWVLSFADGTAVAADYYSNPAR